MVIEDPYPGAKVLCPGCEKVVWWDPVDGWMSVGGATCQPSHTRHDDHIVTLWSPL